MAYVKRVDYFHSQFLLETDFLAEQAYHIDSRRRHNRTLHTTGVADGMEVAPVAGETGQVTISSGVAIDSQGREIVFLDTEPYRLTSTGSGQAVWISVRYDEEFKDQVDLDPGGQADKYIRKTEKPIVVETRQDAPPTDLTLVVLAKLTVNGIDITAVDNAVRTTAGAQIGSKSVGMTQLADRSVGSAQLANQSVGSAQLANQSVGNAQLADLSVGSTKLANQAVTFDKLHTVRIPAEGTASVTFGNQAQFAEVDLFAMNPNTISSTTVLVHVLPADNTVTIPWITWSELIKVGDPTGAGELKVVRGIRFTRNPAPALTLNCVFVVIGQVDEIEPLA